MTRKELINKVLDLGYAVDVKTGYLEIYDEETWAVLANINEFKRNCFHVNAVEDDELCKLVFEYATTKIKERRQKMYRLRFFKRVEDLYKNGPYLAVDGDMLFFGDEGAVFTEGEISRMPHWVQILLEKNELIKEEVKF